MIISDFSIDAIHEAHSKFTGVNFPKLIQAFKDMGMHYYIFNLQTGTITYEHKNGEQIKVEATPVDDKINSTPSHLVAQEVLKRHQAGETDFPAFCKEIAGAGVYKWVSDMEKMTCSYFDLDENIVVVEAIPSSI